MNERPANKKKILFINLYVEMGGGEYSLLNLLKGLNRDEFKPIMMFNKRGVFSEKVESLGVKTIYIPYQTVELKKLINPTIFWQNVKASIQIYKYLKGSKIDIIQCSDVLALLFLAVPSMLLRIPIIYSIIFYYEWARLLLFNLLGIFITTKIITNSKAVEMYLLNNSMFLTSRTETLYNGIDTSLFYPSTTENTFRREFNISANTKLVGMVARFDKWKGHITFLKAASQILQKRNDIRFVIVGGWVNKNEIPSIQNYFNDVMQYYNDLGHKDKIHFVGHRDNMPEVMRGLDILVCPSEFEPFGLIILEAMASEVPVIAADSGGPLEIIDNGKDGFLFQTRDPYSLRDKINLCLDRPDNKIVETATKKVREKFNISQYVERMENIYKEIN